MIMRFAAIWLLPLLSLGCTKHIPGTEIDDNKDTRAIIDVIEKYRSASERRDPDGILALVSTTYFDDAGTPDPKDDLDYERLRQALGDDFRRLNAVKLELAVKKVNVEGDKASAQLFYDGYFRITTPSGEVPKQDSDLHMMKFKREGSAWKVVTGL
jgi:hypothetical protein